MLIYSVNTNGSIFMILSQIILYLYIFFLQKTKKKTLSLNYALVKGQKISDQSQIYNWSHLLVTLTNSDHLTCETCDMQILKKVKIMSQSIFLNDKLPCNRDSNLYNPQTPSRKVAGLDHLGCSRDLTRMQLLQVLQSQVCQVQVKSQKQRFINIPQNDKPVYLMVFFIASLLFRSVHVLCLTRSSPTSAKRTREGVLIIANVIQHLVTWK